MKEREAMSEEPDPATAEDPPSDIRAGDQKRDPEGSEAHRADRMDTGISQQENIDPESPPMHSGDQGS